MANKKIGDAEKPVPEILRTPMRYDWDILVELMLAERTGKKIAARIMDRPIRQFRERVEAVNDYYDLPNSENTLSERELRMCLDRFPHGFRAIPEGLNVKGRRKWTMSRKIDLVRFIDRSRENGVDLDVAADWYLFLDGVDCDDDAADWDLFLEGKKMLTVSGIVARYYEFKKQLLSGDFTTLEKLEIAKLSLQQLPAESTK